MRDIWDGRVTNARPVTVVRDDDGLIALWMAPDSQWKVATKPNGHIARIPLDADWEHRDRVWTGGGALHLITPGAAHAVWALWSEGHTRLTAWYVNLQEPIRRTRIGFDYTDHLLDLVVSADLADWRYKDQRELDEACIRGLIPIAKAHALRAEGERVLACIQRGQPPFDPGWARWSPDPNWPIPELPPDWSIAG